MSLPSELHRVRIPITGGIHSQERFDRPFAVWRILQQLELSFGDARVIRLGMFRPLREEQLGGFVDPLHRRGIASLAIQVERDVDRE